MIKSFADQSTFDLYYQRNTKKARRRLPPELWDKAQECFDAIDQAKRPINLTQYGMEKLKGERKDTYSIRINRQYRVTFEWDDGDAESVKIEDYHG